MREEDRETGLPEPAPGETIEAVTIDEETPAEPPPPPPPDVPVGGADRIGSLDVLRGVAILGIMMINIWTFALPYPAALNPNFAGFDEGADRVVYTFVHMVGYNKMFPVFSMLFGAGILLFTGRVEARGGRSGRRWFARQWWLWVIALLHGYLLWNGDILLPYAVVGLILYRFRRLKPRTLVILAVLAMLVPKVATWGLGEGMAYVRDEAVAADAALADGEELTAQQEKFQEIWTENGAAWTPDAAEFEEIKEVMRGGYVGIFKRGGTELIMMHLFMYPLIANWSIGGLMLLGMALFKTGVLQGERTDRFYGTMALICYGLGLPIAWLGMRFMDANFGDLILMMQRGFLIGDVGGPLVALGHVALVMLAVRRSWLGALQARLAAAGRMAFTNYLAQTVIGVTIFYGYGLGLYGSMSRLELFGVMVAMWVAQLLWSPWWLARFRFGPAEWLWRSLTYRRRQPMRREALAAE